MKLSFICCIVVLLQAIPVLTIRLETVNVKESIKQFGGLLN